MGTINLADIAAESGGFVINGQCAGDLSGWSLAGAGDVNGDGLADLIIGAYRSDPAAGSYAGRSYVVFGRTGTIAVDLSAIAAGTGGFVVNGECTYDYSGISVAGAGDVNGDGLADLIVGALCRDTGAGPQAGRSYVIFGRSGSDAIDLSAVAAGTGGFAINGQCAYDLSGGSVAGAGDVNGDGLADLVVGALQSHPAAGEVAGRSYVVFGRSGSSAIDLSAVAAGTGGFVINGQCEGDFSGQSVAGVGDVNGDGLADVIVGAKFSDPASGNSAGRSYVVFGKSEGSVVDLSAVAAGTGGFVINGQCTADFSGERVAGAGDVNGDGLADVIVGAKLSDPAAGRSAGRSYVVFGRTGEGTIDLSAIAAGTGGFVINGECTNDFSGGSVAGAGDVNGDGLADVIVGAYVRDTAAGIPAGRSYVVFGRSAGTAIDLSAVAAGSGGFVIDGQCANDRSGFSVAGGDINGDGLADLIVGAYGSDPAAGLSAGRSYVVFGSTTGAFAQTAVDQLGADGDDLLTGGAAGETLVGGAGNDTLTGGGGADVLYGGAGDDRFVIDASSIIALSENLGAGGNAGQLSRIDGGSGLDTLALEGTGVALDLTAIANQGATTPGSASRLEDIERIDLTGSGDNILVLAAEDLLDISDSGNTLRVDGNAGDAVTFTNAGSAVVNEDASYYRFTRGAVTLEVNTQISITLAGSDSLDDTLAGTSGADTLLGLGGNDFLDGGGGDDALIGGAADDTYQVDSGSDSVTELAPDGRDLVQSTATSYTLPDHVEDLALAGSGSINGTGNEEINVLTGNGGDNTLNGGAGEDTLSGRGGNDKLVGGGQRDTLLGGEGNDVLDGLAGADVLTGGAGADLFDFDAVGHSGTTASTRDRITDFRSNQGDRVDLSTIDANGSGAGNGGFTFIGSATFSGDATGKLRFDADNHLLLGSTDADTAAEFSILLTGVNDMTGANFIL